MCSKEAEGTLWEQPLSRSTDPHTSYEAARDLAESGKWNSQKIAVYKCLRKHDGATGAEIANFLGIDRHTPSRRLPEIERTGYIMRGEARRCSVRGTKQMTWWIVEPDKTEKGTHGTATQ